MTLEFEILSNSKLQYGFELCRNIITQKNPDFVHSVLQFMTLYDNVLPSYNFEQILPSSSLQLVDSATEKAFYTTESEALSNIIYIDVDTAAKTLSITFDQHTFKNLEYVASGQGIVPVEGWPKMLGIHGAIPERSGYLIAKIKYPVKQVAKMLTENNQVLLALEEVSLAGEFVAADTDLEKIIIVAKAIIASVTSK